MEVNNQSDIILYHNCDMTTLGERVKARRKELRLTQKELASKSGVSQTTISDMERGRNSGSREIAMLARALKVSSYWLATNSGPKEIEENEPPRRPFVANFHRSDGEAIRADWANVGGDIKKAMQRKTGRGRVP